MEEKLKNLISQIQQDSQDSRNYRAVGYHYVTKKNSHPRECRFLGFVDPTENLECFPEEVTFCLEENCSGVKILKENAVSYLSSSNLLCHKLSTIYQPVVRTTRIKTNKVDNESDFLGYIGHLQDIQELFGEQKIDYNIIPKKKTNGMFIEIIGNSSNNAQGTSDDEESADDSKEDSETVKSTDTSRNSDDSNLDDTVNDVEMAEDTNISEYERIRLDNIKERKQFLIKMGLMKERQNVTKKTLKVKITKSNVVSRKVHPTRRSLRLSNGHSELFSLPYDAASDDEEDEQVKKVNVKRPNSYGVIKGVDIGEWWATRLECNAAGIHRPTVAGIHPGPKGAYSVVLSGGYDDDIDNGDSFTYTGSGGRDLKGTKNNPKNLRTAPQSKNQTLNLGNAALVYSCEHKKPIRVVRGYKLKSSYAPEEGYRYDGLYEIDKWWLSEGTSGFLTYKFLFKRCKDQDPPPWKQEEAQDTTTQEKEE